MKASPISDPNGPHPHDSSDREIDDDLDGIDWDEIIATTQPDFLAGRFAFNSADYSTDEAAMAALDCWLDDVFQKVLRETASRNAGECPCTTARGLQR